MKKEKRRLVLNGTDDAYAKRDAVQDPKSEEAPEGEVAAHENSAPKRPIPKPVMAKRPYCRPATPATKAELKAQVPPPSIQMNVRLNLGSELSMRLQRLADAHDQPIDLIVKGVRNKAADRFKALASGATKPPIPDTASGGQSIRYAATLTGDLAENLKAWFDPFGLGVAKNACKPILIWLFQDEAQALCEAAERKIPNHR